MARMRSPQWNGAGSATAGQRTVRRISPVTGSCASSVSVTTSRLVALSSRVWLGRCAYCADRVPARRLQARHRARLRVGLSSASLRTAPVSTMVPSTVRRRPSEREAIAAAGAGWGCMSAHHAPSRTQRRPSGTKTMRWARNAATTESTATSARAKRTRLGRSQSQCTIVIPTANSHAA